MNALKWTSKQLITFKLANNYFDNFFCDIADKTIKHASAQNIQLNDLHEKLPVLFAQSCASKINNTSNTIYFKQ